MSCVGSGKWVNPSSAKLSYLRSYFILPHLNVHQLEVVSRYRDPQLQVGEKYSYLSNLRLNIHNFHLFNINLCKKLLLDMISCLLQIFTHLTL